MSPCTQLRMMNSFLVRNRKNILQDYPALDFLCRLSVAICTMLLAEKLNDVTIASWATSSILQLCCSASAFGRGRALCPCAQSICDYFNHIKSYKPCLSLHILPLQYFKKRNYFVGHSIYSTLRTFSRSNRWIKSLAQITYDSESSF